MEWFGNHAPHTPDGCLHLFLTLQPFIKITTSILLHVGGVIFARLVRGITLSTCKLRVAVGSNLLFLHVLMQSLSCHSSQSIIWLGILNATIQMDTFNRHHLVSLRCGSSLSIFEGQSIDSSNESSTCSFDFTSLEMADNSTRCLHEYTLTNKFLMHLPSLPDVHHQVCTSC